MPKDLSLISWNVNGIRAAERKGFLDWLAKAPADIVCVQETKAHVDQLGVFLRHPDGYESFWNAATERKGYSGTAVYTQVPPTFVASNLGNSVLDTEGRIICLEYEHFFLFNVYFPNGGGAPERLAYKLKFYDEFLAVTETMRKQKPIVICGDLNVAHREIDIARPKENKNHVGFLPEERAWMDRVLAAGYVDTFRYVHDDVTEAYSWWDLKTGARARNVGWRIDYFLVSEELKPHIKDAWISPELEGSDHCPVGLRLTF